MKTFKAILFWIISCTWGLPMTLFGAVGALALLVTGHKPHRFHYFIYFKVGENWGGLEAGPFFFMDNSAGYSTQAHEAGHGIQNIIFGPFMPFIVSIRSALRYWLFDESPLAMAIIRFIMWVGLIGGFALAVLLYPILGAAICFYFAWLCYFCQSEYLKLAGGCRDYYAIWFERTASEWGKKYFSKID